MGIYLTGRAIIHFDLRIRLYIEEEHWASRSVDFGSGNIYIYHQLCVSVLLSFINCIRTCRAYVWAWYGKQPGERKRYVRERGIKTGYCDG